MKQTLHAARIGVVRQYARTRTRQTSNRFAALTATVEPEIKRTYARRQNRILDIWCGFLDLCCCAIDVALCILGSGNKER
jgi:uncharacterized membrane protein